MEFLEESIETLRRENEFEKQEIISYLDQLIQIRDDISKSSAYNNSSKNAYITDLCKYEQQINHKLTEIKFELKKFIAHNTPPICKPPRTKLDDDPIDIETLKKKSMRLISKLEEYSVKDVKQLKSEYSGILSPDYREDNISDEVKYPYVSESTLEKLSDHTKCMLKDLSISGDVNQCSVQAEGTSIDTTLCGHFPEIEAKFPAISKSCSLSSVSTCNSEVLTNNTSDHFAQIERLKEIINICQVKNGEPLKKSVDKKIESLNSSSSSELGENHDVATSSFLGGTLILSNNSETVCSQLLSKPIEENFICSDLKNRVSKVSEEVDENLKTVDISSNMLCSTNYLKGQKIENFDVRCCDSILKSGEEDLIDLGDFTDLGLPSTETVTDDSESTKYLSIESELFKSTEDIYASAENVGVIGNMNEFMRENVELSETSDLVEISSSSTIQLNNKLSISESDNSKLYVQYDTDNICENRGYCKGSETKEEKESQGTNTLKKQNLKDMPRLQNNLADDIQNLVTPSLFVCKEPQPSSICENVKDCNLNANTDKSIYSAQEKIMKLGLEDRMTRFERTRQVAPLPDLRLQPSMLDNEKNIQISEQSNKFEIKDKDIPNMYATCVFSHVESPFEFYIHLDDEESKLIDCFNELITQHFRKTTTPYRSKLEAFEKIGKFCCAYIRNDKTYYRAEVVDWLFDKETKIVLVQLIDYGNVTVVHYKHLRELTKEFSMLPKIAVKCYLPMLYPPGSTKTNLLSEWPMTTIEALRELGGLCDSNTNILYKIFYVQKEGDSTGVDMYEEGDNELNTVGQLLIDLGHAVQIVLPTDDPMGVVSDDKDIERMEACDNINEVILGYDPKDEGRICRFTRKDGTCFKGKNCKLEHLQFSRGGYTSDHTLAFYSAVSEIKLPQETECINIRFTVFLGASHYYINLMEFADSLISLEKVMNDKRSCATFQQYKIMPAYGETVLVKHWSKRWLRGRVRHHSYDEEGNCAGVQVFMVDYGDIVDVSLKDIRQINPEYLELPFQAVECILYNYKARNDVDLKVMDKFFYDNMFFREFVGHVMGHSDMILCLRVYHKDRDIGKILAERGFLTEIGTQIFPSNDAIVVPG